MERDLEVRVLIGYVLQDVVLYPDLAAREKLAFLGRVAAVLDGRGCHFDFR